MQPASRTCHLLPFTSILLSRGLPPLTQSVFQFPTLWVHTYLTCRAYRYSPVFVLRTVHFSFSVTQGPRQLDPFTLPRAPSSQEYSFHQSCPPPLTAEIWTWQPTFETKSPSRKEVLEVLLWKGRVCLQRAMGICRITLLQPTQVGTEPVKDYSFGLHKIAVYSGPGAWIKEVLVLFPKNLLPSGDKEKSHPHFLAADKLSSPSYKDHPETWSCHDLASSPVSTWWLLPPLSTYLAKHLDRDWTQTAATGAQLGQTSACCLSPSLSFSS